MLLFICWLLYRYLLSSVGRSASLCIHCTAAPVRRPLSMPSKAPAPAGGRAPQPSPCCWPAAACCCCAPPSGRWPRRLLLLLLPPRPHEESCSSQGATPIRQVQGWCCCCRTAAAVGLLLRLSPAAAAGPAVLGGGGGGGGALSLGGHGHARRGRHARVAVGLACIHTEREGGREDG